MEALHEKIFTGKWRSFKVFRSMGQILLHTEDRFQEFDFSADRLLTIKTFEKNRMQRQVQTDQWKISFEKQKHFLSVPLPKLRYEVITVNHTVMVLMELASGEKTFFAREQHWKWFLESNQAILL